MKPVIVVGAGFSGLSLAWELRKRNIPVLIVERAARAGGIIQTVMTKNGRAETAANGFLRTEKVESFLREVGADVLLSSEASKRRYIYRDAIRRWPLTISETLLTAAHVVWSLMHGRRFFVPRDRETIAQWGTRCIGESASQNILCVALQGIYGTNTGELSAELILGPLFDKKFGIQDSPGGQGTTHAPFGKAAVGDGSHEGWQQPRRSKRLGGLVTGKMGMGPILEKIKIELEKRGVDIHLSEKFSWANYSDCEAAVICTSYADAGDILSERFRHLGKRLQSVSGCDIASVKVFVDEESKEMRPGFGILFGLKKGITSLGVLFNANIFNWAERSETWILPMIGSADETVQSVLRDRQQVLKLDKSSVLSSHVDFWPRGLPRYDLRLKDVIADLRSSAELKKENVYLHGNYLGSIGLSRILEDSEALAQSIESSIEKTAMQKNGIGGVEISAGRS